MSKQEAVDDEIVIVQGADDMLAREFIQHVFLRHKNLGYRSRENHEAEHIVNPDAQNHLHEDGE